jgi:polyisoprenoid-binding protein YceI
VEKFPQANLIISSVTPKGGDNYDIVGKLTIKGTTSEVKFPAVVKAEKGKLTAQAKISVDRTKYNIKYGSKSFFDNLGDKAIDNEFQLDVNLVATADAAKASR